MLLFLQGIIELISDLDYVLNATQNEKITVGIEKPPSANISVAHALHY